MQAARSDANLRGHAPANALVTARNVDTGATRETRASSAGTYALVGLQPGTWKVDAGPGMARTVTLSVASTATVNLVATAAAPAAAPAANAANITTMGTVTVSAAAMREVKTSEVGNLVSLRQIDTTPQSSRA